jgi:glycosyltransferase involved in cell wall biosynthesis
MQKILHLIPYDGTGGVESAAQSMQSIHSNELSFEIKFLFKRNVKRWETFNPFLLIPPLFQVLSLKPNILIVSLWRSCIIGSIVKILNPDIKVILLLHYPKNVHFVDKAVTSFTSRIATEVWSDSQETMNGRFPRLKNKNQKIISFVTQIHESLDGIELRPNFIFWGRVHKQKGLDSALKIFSQVKEKYTSAKFLIIGPDGGELKALKKMANNLNLNDGVEFYDAMPLNDIKKYASNSSFFLQPSILEGMGISVIEAMQFGLIPVVTAVGEMKNYCRNMHNSILIVNNDEVLANIFGVLASKKNFFQIRENAINSWKDTELYSDSMLQACKNLI